MPRTKAEIQKDIDSVKLNISAKNSLINKNLDKGRYDIEWRRIILEIQNNILNYQKELEELNQELKEVEQKEQKQQEKLRDPKGYYQSLIDKKKAAHSEREFSDLAEEFRAMGNYKDSYALAKECDNAAMNEQYNRLVREKNKASTENEYQNLARQFRYMNGYKNTTELAKECDNAAMNEQYNRLVQEKNKASTEDEYQNLARQFRYMSGYKNTTELAKECEEKAKECEKREEKAKKLAEEIIEYERFKEEEKRLFLVIFGIVLGGIIGGSLFAFFHTEAGERDFVGGLAGFAGILGFILGMIEEGCGAGIFGLIVAAIAGAIIAVIFNALLPKIPFATSIAIGAIIGALPKWMELCEIQKKNKQLYWTIFIVLSIIAIALTFTSNYLQKGSFTDSRDKKKYGTIKIGTQTWMAENLNYDGERSICYDDYPADCEKYGRLYDWETAKKACPPGWHLPSDAEWQKLVDFAGGKEVAGKKLKFGFSALPGGYGNSGGKFRNVGEAGYWWSATEYDDSLAWYRYMNSNSARVIWDDGAKSVYTSVRCAQD